MKSINKRAIIIVVIMISITCIIAAACNIQSIRREQTDESRPTEETTMETTKETAPPETTAPVPTTADGIPLPVDFPQIDSSTARIPITDALYALFVSDYGLEGPAPICSKTHQALLNLADGTVDFVFAILPTEEEIAYYDEKNVDIEARLYGCDGLVFIGNSANPVKNLTPDQIKSIYRGEITNWKDLGGDDAPIVAYYRDSQSGSQRFFENLVWAGETIPDFSGLTKEMTESDDMGEITTNVIFDKYAIGFNIMSYVDMSFDSSDLMLFSVNGVSPTTETLADSSYEYVTEAYILIRADAPEDSPERWLFNWFGSNESRQLLTNNSELSLAFSEPYLIHLSEGNSELTPITD
jgi:phosphate transport system substrate-binding protein